MMLTFHIGKCCGIKTVYGFPYSPTGPLEKVGKLVAIEQNNSDANGRHVSSTDRFFHEAAPSETATERLDRYIQYMKKRRPQNLLECTLIEPSPGSSTTYWTHEAWFPVLKERGFRRVSRFRNSNSGNIVNVFHLTINNGPEQSQEDVDADDDGWEDDED